VRPPVRACDFGPALAAVACSDCAVSAQAVAKVSAVDREYRDSPVSFSVGPALPVFQDPKQAVGPAATAGPEWKVCPAFLLLDSTVAPELGEQAFPVSWADYLHFPASTDLALGSASPALPDSKALPVLWTEVRPVLDEYSEAQAAMVFPGGPELPDEAAAEPGDMADGIREGDNASRRDIPAGSTTRSADGDTTGAADDTDSPILPNKRDCIGHGVRPSSNPIRPIPRAG